MKIFYVFLLLMFYHTLSSQAELVADINEGSEDSGIFCNYNYTKNQNCNVKIADKILFFAENSVFGRELYVLHEGKLELLKDLNNDPSSSNPEYLTVFNGLTYFIANDGTGYKIWQTDGTKDGTKIAFDLAAENASSSDYTAFLINEDEMYFAFQGSIYVYNKQDLIKVVYDKSIVISSSSVYNSDDITP